MASLLSTVLIMVVESTAGAVCMKWEITVLTNLIRKISSAVRIFRRIIRFFVRRDGNVYQKLRYSLQFSSQSQNGRDNVQFVFSIQSRAYQMSLSLND